MSLAVGEPSQKLIWIIKGPTKISSHHLEALHKLGLCSRDYQGQIFILRTLKFLLEGEEITKDHQRVYSLLGSSHFKETKRPTSAEESPSPFGPTFRSMWVSDSSSDEEDHPSPIVIETKKKKNPPKKKAPDPDPDTDEEIFSLFD
jgi:hypothetical protein